LASPCQFGSLPPSIRTVSPTSSRRRRRWWLDYTSNLELAKPLTRELAASRGHGDAKSLHLFFSLTANF